MHWYLERALNVTRDVTHQAFARRVLPIRIEGGMVSFTFDDVPESAITVGSKVLERHGVSGTFYLSGGLADSIGDRGPYFRATTVESLIRRGHEIGCHTFSHRRVSDIPVNLVIDECDQNRDWLTNLCPEYRLCSFAYPQGAFNISAKRLLGKRYISCRWNQPGINVGDVDVAMLRANKVYSRLENADDLKALIDDNARRGGWLVFYTHDVGDSPSRFGCTTTDLESIVSSAVASGSRVLSIRNAIGAAAFSF